MAPVFFIYEIDGIEKSIPALLILSFLTTAIGHTLFIYSFKNFSISTASIISSIQPVYGIIIGMIILGEFPNPNTMIGGILILGTVIIESFRTYKN